jgi:hypothetical protein
MTAEELLAIIAASGRDLSSPQRVLVARFVAALATNGGAAERAAANRVRKEIDRDFEERELGPGPNLERRRREPAG